MRISDWSSDVCSSDLGIALAPHHIARERRFDPAPLLLFGAKLEQGRHQHRNALVGKSSGHPGARKLLGDDPGFEYVWFGPEPAVFARNRARGVAVLNQQLLPGYARSEEHTSELQSLMRISYSVFCLKKQYTSYTMLRRT